MIAINSFQRMDHLYLSEVMECYRSQGEDVHTNISSRNNAVSRTSNSSSDSNAVTPFKANPRKAISTSESSHAAKLPPHAYKTADDAYRAMKRGLENSMLMNSKKKRNTSSGTPLVTPANQSI